MYLAIGFLVAGLVGVMFAPLIHGRAVRLTVRRLEGALPLQMSEIRADKDLLRAEFAIATRRLEMMIEQLRNKNASQLIELGRKSEGINRLKFELNALRVAGAKVVAAYASREPIRPTVRRSVPENTQRRDGEVGRLLGVLARRRSGDRRPLSRPGLVASGRLIDNVSARCFLNIDSNSPSHAPRRSPAPSARSRRRCGCGIPAGSSRPAPSIAPPASRAPPAA